MTADIPSPRSRRLDPLEAWSRSADVAHGEALEAMLRKVRLPRILVPTFGQQAAA